jgi:hypothetical protein
MQGRHSCRAAGTDAGTSLSWEHHELMSLWRLCVRGCRSSCLRLRA